MKRTLVINFRTETKRPIDAAPCHGLLIAQRLNRIDLRGLKGRIDSEKHAYVRGKFPGLAKSGYGNGTRIPLP